MAVVMQLTWAGVSPEQYDQARDKAGWETDSPAGSIFHVAWFEPRGIRVVDVWESADAFQQFSTTRLMPAVEAVGITGQPEVTIQDAHRVFDAVHGEARS